jgi:hypothetical protein
MHVEIGGVHVVGRTWAMKGLHDIVCATASEGPRGLVFTGAIPGKDLKPLKLLRWAFVVSHFPGPPCYVLSAIADILGMLKLMPLQTMLVVGGGMNFNSINHLD